ncbi:MAG: tetratricopeptide repeat protein [Treponema sp.]|nr:tetratricopeptide repeat protein [Spirochaetales bacterium]MDY4832589.1 tetratricopeptide repeat protein [Treponema sp.]MDY5918389.1 tetratricopeptide repeat protein [Treponema sp.]MDY6190566.1 tetratricopeptide repeat protein [Treponema sp.]
MVFSVLIAVIVAAVLVVFLMMSKIVAQKHKNSSLIEKVHKKGKSALVKEAEKKLVKDPHNIPALETIGEIYYQDKNWEKVWGVYKTLYDLSAAHIEIDVAKSTLRMGLSAFYQNRIEDAVNVLMVTIKKDPDNFEANLVLGKVLLQKNIIDKAAYCLKKAKTLMPENNEVNALLGKCLFKMQKYRESLQFIKQALEESPDNKELLYDMAVAMSECGLSEKALKVFIHLRPDPEFGPLSCLEAGKMHERVKDFQNAIKDYEIALRHQNMNEQLAIQIKYRLGNTYIAMNNISQGLVYLKQVQMMKAGYKDTDSLVSRYAELNQNKNLQIYLLSGTSDFVALCRKLISVFFKESFVKIEDIQVTSGFVEIVCNAENVKWESKQIFRFYRTQNIIGDLYIREFHGKIRDTKCDNGVCVTVGSFSESAHRFVEGRPLTLVEKDELTKMLKKITAMNG